MRSGDKQVMTIFLNCHSMLSKLTIFFEKLLSEIGDRVQAEIKAISWSYPRISISAIHPSCT